MINQLLYIVDVIPFLQIVSLAFLAILFLQSGLDKVFNYQGNLDWLKGHFKKSPLKNSVGLLMPVITILEVAAGFCCALGIVLFLVNGNKQIGILGAELSAISVLSLFFGQRIAQQYDGAASLAGYFVVILATLLILTF